MIKRFPVLFTPPASGSAEATQRPAGGSPVGGRRAGEGLPSEGLGHRV